MLSCLLCWLWFTCFSIFFFHFFLLGLPPCGNPCIKLGSPLSRRTYASRPQSSHSQGKALLGRGILQVAQLAQCDPLAFDFEEIVHHSRGICEACTPDPSLDWFPCQCRPRLLLPTLVSISETCCVDQTLWSYVDPPRSWFLRSILYSLSSLSKIVSTLPLRSITTFSFLSCLPRREIASLRVFAYLIACPTYPSGIRECLYLILCAPTTSVGRELWAC